MGLIKNVATIKHKQLIIVNVSAWVGETLPVGISLVAVLGFRISISLSIYRLKAIAAFRAKTIQRSMIIILFTLKLTELVIVAKKKPMMAKGNVKIMCANKTNEKYFFIL